MNDLRIAVCVPTAGTVPAQFCYSLSVLTSYGQSLRSLPDAQSIALSLMMQTSSVIHANREALVLEAQRWNATHVLFLDDDMCFKPEVLSILLGRRHAMVACNYPKRGWPISFTAIRPDGNGAIVTRPDSTGLEEAAYTGFGVSLIEMKVFAKTPRPWFLPLYLADCESYTTEDNPFCERIKAQGFKVYVDHDASKLVSHVGQHQYDWSQWRPEEPPKPSAAVIDIAKGAA